MPRRGGGPKKAVSGAAAGPQDPAAGPGAGSAGLAERGMHGAASSSVGGKDGCSAQADVSAISCSPPGRTRSPWQAGATVMPPRCTATPYCCAVPPPQPAAHPTRWPPPCRQCMSRSPAGALCTSFPQQLCACSAPRCWRHKPAAKQARRRVAARPYILGTSAPGATTPPKCPGPRSAARRASQPTRCLAQRQPQAQPHADAKSRLPILAALNTHTHTCTPPDAILTCTMSSISHSVPEPLRSTSSGGMGMIVDSLQAQKGAGSGGGGGNGVGRRGLMAGGNAMSRRKDQGNASAASGEAAHAGRWAGWALGGPSGR